MNEQFPYDDELSSRLNELPLPDEGLAWEDMRRRLEEDDRDRPLLPPLLKGCGGIFLLLLLVIGGLLIWDPGNWIHKKTTGPMPVAGNRKITGDPQADSSLAPSQGNKIKETASNQDTTRERENAGATPQPEDQERNDKAGTARSSSANQSFQHSFAQRRGQRHRLPVQKSRKPPAAVSKKTRGSMNSTVAGGVGSDTAALSLGEIDSVAEKTPATAGPVSDTYSKKTPVPGKLADTAVAAAVPKISRRDSVEKNPIYFSVGLGIHQLLPVSGQKTNPYNSLGRKNSLSDYVPSIYLRMYKGKKWFLQSEFRYGAPQYTKEVIYQQSKIIDPSGGFTITSSGTVKKTFYHQLPLSFNYFVLPGMSVGAGITFNKYKSALVEFDTRVTNLATMADSVIRLDVVTQKKPDSNFVTTYFQGLFEAQYAWKRLSAGARYSFGLQPYLQFQLPGGQQRKERNSALQLFIRYELWRSVKN